MEEGLIKPTTSHFMESDRDIAARAGGDEEEEFYDCKFCGFIYVPDTRRLVAYVVPILCVSQSSPSKKNF
jgi:hypothetical protein